MDIINIMKENNIGIAGLTNELKCIYLSKLEKENAIVLVCNSLYEANVRYNSLLNYMENVYLFPMDDFLTSEALAISPEFQVSRLETLNNISKLDKFVVVTNLMGYLRFIPTLEIYKENTIFINKNLKLNPKELITKLNDLGYKREAIVTKTGEIALRGFVIDIFPINEKCPIRIEFWGDEIEVIKTFDLNSQMSIEAIDKIEILPNTEFLAKQDGEYKHSELPNFIKTTNISSFKDNVITVFDDYSQLKSSYRQLQSEIFDYNQSQNKNNKYMYDHIYFFFTIAFFIFKKKKEP